jgi:hypothetical protein
MNKRYQEPDGSNAKIFAPSVNICYPEIARIQIVFNNNGVKKAQGRSSYESKRI